MATEHPTPNELLDHYFEEAPSARPKRVAEHASACPDCQGKLDELHLLDRLLSGVPDETPPAGGLESVLGRISGSHVATTKSPGWLAPLAASLAGIAVSAGMVPPPSGSPRDRLHRSFIWQSRHVIAARSTGSTKQP